jgi:hypothetical protein
MEKEFPEIKDHPYKDFIDDNLKKKKQTEVYPLQIYDKGFTEEQLNEVVKYTRGHELVSDLFKDLTDEQLKYLLRDLAKEAFEQPGAGAFHYQYGGANVMDVIDKPPDFKELLKRVVHEYNHGMATIRYKARHKDQTTGEMLDDAYFASPRDVAPSALREFDLLFGGKKLQDEVYYTKGENGIWHPGRKMLSELSVVYTNIQEFLQKWMGVKRGNITENHVRQLFDKYDDFGYGISKKNLGNNAAKLADLLNRYGAYAAPAGAGYSLLSTENNKK